MEELLRACLYEQEATRRLLMRKGVLTNEEVLEEVKAVGRELEARPVGMRRVIEKDRKRRVLNKELSRYMDLAPLSQLLTLLPQ